MEKKKITPGQIVISVAVGLVTVAIAYWLAFHSAHWLRKQGRPHRSSPCAGCAKTLANAQNASANVFAAPFLIVLRKSDRLVDGKYACAWAKVIVQIYAVRLDVNHWALLGRGVYSTATDVAAAAQRLSSNGDVTRFRQTDPASVTWYLRIYPVAHM